MKQLHLDKRVVGEVVSMLTSQAAAVIRPSQHTHNVHTHTAFVLPKSCCAQVTITVTYIDMYFRDYSICLLGFVYSTCVQLMQLLNISLFVSVVRSSVTLYFLSFLLPLLQPPTPHPSLSVFICLSVRQYLTE